MNDAAPVSPYTNPQPNLSLLKIYTVYRVIVSIMLLVIFLFSSSTNAFLGGHNPQLFFYGITAYLAFNLIGLLVVLPKSKQPSNQQLFINFAIDIIAITWCTHASGGVTDGLQLLLIVTIAASSIMLPIQLSLLTAAMASLAVLTDTIVLINLGETPTSSFVTAGLVGAILFITALIIQNLAGRIRGSQLLAEQRALDVSKLQQLNQQIVEHMRTGIVVCDRSGKILLANKSAGELLGDASLKHNPAPGSRQLSEQLTEQLNKWRAFPQYRTPPIQVAESGRELQVSFSAITGADDAQALIFLEDNRRLVQRAQHMKLASLGRLTASIAHEIRNPLGAISHAAQLLNESEHLDSADQRLCEIIQNHSRRMNKVIENVLQLSSRNAPNPEHITLETWLRQFIEEFKYIGGTDWSIELQSTENAEHKALMDSSQFTQVITNLCQNGLRYSQQQTGEAKVLLRVHRHPVTELPVLDVIDFGPGIDAGIEHIFEPFYTTDPKGSGLGLYISRELCEANEARLDYIRTTEDHSCFRISFPHPDRQLQPE